MYGLLSVGCDNSDLELGVFVKRVLRLQACRLEAIDFSDVLCDYIEEISIDFNSITFDLVGHIALRLRTHHIRWFSHFDEGFRLQRV